MLYAPIADTDLDTDLDTGADTGADTAFDLVDWGKSSAAFALPLAFVVALFKRRYPFIKGGLTLALSFMLAQAGAAGLSALDMLTDPQFAGLGVPWNWLAFGTSAFVGASGGMAALSQLLCPPRPTAPPVAAQGA